MMIFFTLWKQFRLAQDSTYYMLYEMRLPQRPWDINTRFSPNMFTRTEEVYRQRHRLANGRFFLTALH